MRYQGLPPVQIVSATEVNFAMAGFLAAMLSNFAFVFRNIKSKEAQKDIGASMRPAPDRMHLAAAGAKRAGWVEVFAGLGGINLYAWMSILGTIILLPVSLLVEGGQLSAGQASLSSPLQCRRVNVSNTAPHRLRLAAAQSKFAASGALPFLWLGQGTAFITFLLTVRHPVPCGTAVNQLWQGSSFSCCCGFAG